MAFTAQQILAIELLADPTDTRPVKEKAEEAGISAVTLWRWRKNNEFLAAMNQRTSELVNAGRAEAMQCLVRCFRGGDRAAARDYLQVTADIGSGVNVQTNVYNNQEKIGRAHV